MLIENVHYKERPNNFIINRADNSHKVRIEFPTNIIENEEDYTADVYFLDAEDTLNLETRISNNYDAWLAKAKITEVPATTLEDVIEAINTLTEIVLGGE